MANSVDPDLTAPIGAVFSGSKLSASGSGSKLFASGFGSKLFASGSGSKLFASGSGSKLFASILNLSVMLHNYLQQTTSADNIFRCIFS